MRHAGYCSPAVVVRLTCGCLPGVSTKIEKEKREHAKQHGMIRTEITGAEIAEEMEKERRLFQLQMCEVRGVGSLYICGLDVHLISTLFSILDQQECPLGGTVMDQNLHYLQLFKLFQIKFSPDRIAVGVINHKSDNSRIHATCIDTRALLFFSSGSLLLEPGRERVLLHQIMSLLLRDELNI